jgi:ankyrin repeat protein
MTAVPTEAWTSTEFENALLLAAAEGRAGAVLSFLTQGVDVNAADRRGFSPLMLAVRGGHLETARALLEGGADLDLRRGGADAWPALMHAIHRGHHDLAIALLEWGADPDARGKCGYSALMMAAGCGDRSLVAALLLRGADPTARQALGFTAMDYAIGYGHEEIVAMLADSDPGLCEDSRPARRAVVELATRLGYGEILARVGGCAGEAPGA